VPLAGRPMVEWSVEAFRGVAGVRSIVVANALAAVGTELVAIHDAARPLLTAELIEGVVMTLVADPEAAGAIAAAPIADTIKAANRLLNSDAHGVIDSALAVESTLDRDGLWAAQTPQVFRTEALREALAVYPVDAPAPTDEATLVEAAGGRVLIHPAPAENLKVTTPLDLRLAELLLAERTG
jgi:2-C-methyl-D-erythritol 4-phosphate cytidylyltransferase